MHKAVHQEFAIGLLDKPTPADVRAARKRANLSQSAAGKLISPLAQRGAYRTWQAYEVECGKEGHNDIPMVVWEMFLLLTGQHPSMQLAKRELPALQTQATKSASI